MISGCERVVTDLVALRRGELAAGDSARVAFHLAGCAGCRGALHEIDRIFGLLERFPGLARRRGFRESLRRLVRGLLGDGPEVASRPVLARDAAKGRR